LIFAFQFQGYHLVLHSNLLDRSLFSCCTAVDRYEIAVTAVAMTLKGASTHATLVVQALNIPDLGSGILPEACSDVYSPSGISKNPSLLATMIPSVFPHSDVQARMLRWADIEPEMTSPLFY
jgi:hypothetical protein